MDGQVLLAGLTGACRQGSRAGGDVAAEAAARVGIGIKTAIDWVRHYRETGRLAALPRGGRRPKKLVGEYRDWLLQRCGERDFTLRGLVAELGNRGLKVDYRVVWEFVHAENLSYKKRR